jgi:hypothetical protein
LFADGVAVLSTTIGVFVGRGREVLVGRVVDVAGMGVFDGRVVGIEVFVGRLVAVDGTDVFVTVAGISVLVAVGGRGVFVFWGGTGELVTRAVAVGTINVLVGVGDVVTVRVGIEANAVRVANADDCKFESVGVTIGFGVLVAFALWAVTFKAVGVGFSSTGDSTAILAVVAVAMALISVGVDRDNTKIAPIASAIPPNTKIAVRSSLLRLRFIILSLHRQNGCDGEQKAKTTTHIGA